MVLNTEEHAVEISAADIGTGESLGDAEAYILTSYPGVLTSRDAFLNGKCSSSLCAFFRSLTRGSVGTGKVLKLADPVKGVLPDMPPAKIPSGEPVSLPPKSYGWVVFPDAGAGACTAGVRLKLDDDDTGGVAADTPTQLELQPPELFGASKGSATHYCEFGCDQHALGQPGRPS